MHYISVYANIALLKPSDEVSGMGNLEVVKGSVAEARQTNVLLVAAKKRGDSYMIESLRIRRDDWMENARLYAS